MSTAQYVIGVCQNLGLTYEGIVYPKTLKEMNARDCIARALVLKRGLREREAADYLGTSPEYINGLLKNRRG